MLPKAEKALRRLVELGLEGREAMSGEVETPLEAPRHYVTEQEAKIVQQQLLLRRLAATRRSTVIAERDLAAMEFALILLRGRVARLSGTAPDDASA